MAIFNETFTTNEAAEWHGKYLLTEKELHDPKFRKAQFDQVVKIVKDALNSPEYKKNFEQVDISFPNYYTDDDESEMFDKWASGKHRVIDIICFKKDQADAAKDAGDYLVKVFAKAKKENNGKIFGSLKFNSKFGCFLDYKL